MAAPQGFEPRYADPESAVLPLNEGAAIGEKRKRRRETSGMIDFKLGDDAGQTRCEVKGLPPLR